MAIEQGAGGSSPGSQHILVVDDDPRLRALMERGLAEAGYRCTTAADAQLARGVLESETDVDMVLVDVMMPGEDGWEFVQSLRDDRNDVPVMFVTARDAVPERVHGLRIGADDYMIKPFDFGELLARVDAVLRRRAAGRRLEVGPMAIDLERRLVWLGERRLELSPREFSLLVALAERSGKVVTRPELLREVWGIDFDTGTNTVDVHIARLRKRLGRDYSALLRTVVGQGYVLDEAEL
jgi:DNA-binding response OmpR family regulator